MKKTYREDFLGGSVVKNLPAKATHSSILGQRSVAGLKRVGHNWGSVHTRTPGGDPGLITGLGRFHMLQGSEADALKLLKHTEATPVRSLCIATGEQPLLTTTRESPCAAMKTQHSQK